MSLSACLAAFERGELGRALRDLRIAGMSVSEARRLLAASGFRAWRQGLLAERTRDGKPQWRCYDGGVATDREDARIVRVDVRARGVEVVRIFPRGEPSGRIVPADVPSAIKSILFAPVRVGDDGEPEASFLTREAFRLTDEGLAVPRGRRAVDGIRYSAADPVESWRFANDVSRLSIVLLRRERAS